MASSCEQHHEQQHQAQKAELGKWVGLFANQSGPDVLDGGAVCRQNGEGDHLRSRTLRVLIPSHDFHGLESIALEGVGYGLSNQVGVVVGNAVLIAVVVDINVPCYGEVIHIVQCVKCAASIEQARLVGHARKRCRSDDGGCVEHKDFEHFAGVSAVVVGNVVHEFVGAASIPGNRQVISDDIAIVIGAAEIIRIHARVDVPATHEGVDVRRRVG